MAKIFVVKCEQCGELLKSQMFARVRLVAGKHRREFPEHAITVKPA